MTNEEAIEILKGIMDDDDNHNIAWACGASDAFEMAISALEKQDVSDTTVGDMISRSDAIDAVECALAFHSYAGGIAGRAIRNLPSAQPESDCVLKEFGNCSYSETGCSDCKVKAKIRNALSAQPNLQPTCNNLATDTISRQTAIDALKRNTFRLTFAEEQNCEGHVAWSAKAVYSEVMEGVLLDLPSVQPEIIMCKDCVNYDKARNRINGYCCLLDIPMYADDWCSRAERKKE